MFDSLAIIFGNIDKLVRYLKTRKAVRGLRQLECSPDAQKDKSPPYHKVFPWRDIVGNKD